MTDPWLPQEVFGIASVIPFTIGLGIIVVGVAAAPRYGLHTARAFGNFLGFGLEFLLAATIIRLAGDLTFEMLGIAASVIVARRVVLLGLHYGQRVTG